MIGIVLARSSKKALEYLHSVEAFLAKRGLKLSHRKTNILPIEKGVDFLSRRYQKIGEDESGRKGKIQVEPSKKAIECFC